MPRLHKSKIKRNKYSYINHRNFYWYNIMGNSLCLQIHLVNKTKISQKKFVTVAAMKQNEIRSCAPHIHDPNNHHSYPSIFRAIRSFLTRFRAARPTQLPIQKLRMVLLHHYSLYRYSTSHRPRPTKTFTARYHPQSRLNRIPVPAHITALSPHKYMFHIIS